MKNSTKVAAWWSKGPVFPLCFFFLQELFRDRLRLTLTFLIGFLFVLFQRSPDPQSFAALLNFLSFFLAIAWFGNIFDREKQSGRVGFLAGIGAAPRALATGIFAATGIAYLLSFWFFGLFTWLVSVGWRLPSLEIVQASALICVQSFLPILIMTAAGLFLRGWLNALFLFVVLVAFSACQGLAESMGIYDAVKIVFRILSPAQLVRTSHEGQKILAFSGKEETGVFSLQILMAGWFLLWMSRKCLLRTSWGASFLFPNKGRS